MKELKDIAIMFAGIIGALVFGFATLYIATELLHSASMVTGEDILKYKVGLPIGTAILGFLLVTNLIARWANSENK
jgi:hypothetical protein